MPYFRIIRYLIASSLLIATFGIEISCATRRQVIDLKVEREIFGYIQDGKTNRQEFIDRLGFPWHSYENGRIVIYTWFDQEHKGYDIVLVFNEDNVLERHSVVRVK